MQDLVFFNLFSHFSDTVLGDTGDPWELFIIDDCDDNRLGATMDKVGVRVLEDKKHERIAKGYCGQGEEGKH